MRRRNLGPTLALALLAGMVCIIAPLQAEESIEGTWFAELVDRDEDGPVLYMEMRQHKRRGRHEVTFPVAVHDLAGLTPEQVEAGTGSIEFALERDAGVARYEGRFHGGTGSGRFTFVVDEGFANQLKKRGFRAIRPYEYYALALQNVTLRWLDELEALGYDDLEVDDLIAMAVHEVSADFVRQMQDLGFVDLDPDDLLAARIHGVTPDYVAAVRNQGMRSDDIQNYIGMRIHRVDPEFLEEMRQLGYELTMDEGLSFRIHGVDADFVAELHELGYDDLSAEQLLELKIHGVDAQYIRRIHRHRRR